MAKKPGYNDESTVCVPKARLKLGRGMFLPELYEPCEKAVGKKLWEE